MNEITKWLDSGWTLLVFKNDLGSYTALLTKEMPPDMDNLPENQITDDFTPEKTIHRLAEKMLGNITEEQNEQRSD